MFSIKWSQIFPWPKFLNLKAVFVKDWIKWCREKFNKKETCFCLCRFVQRERIWRHRAGESVLSAVGALLSGCRHQQGSWTSLLKQAGCHQIFKPSFLSPGLQTCFLQAELRQELQVSRFEESSPAGPESQQWGGYISASPQSSIHPHRIRSESVAGGGSLQPLLPQDTDGRLRCLLRIMFYWGFWSTHSCFNRFFLIHNI